MQSLTIKAELVLPHLRLSGIAPGYVEGDDGVRSLGEPLWVLSQNFLFSVLQRQRRREAIAVDELRNQHSLPTCFIIGRFTRKRV